MNSNIIKIDDNLLVTGYLREVEYNTVNQIIPKLIRYLVAIYCQSLQIFGINENTKKYKYFHLITNLISSENNLFVNSDDLFITSNRNHLYKTNNCNKSGTTNQIEICVY